MYHRSFRIFGTSRFALKNNSPRFSSTNPEVIISKQVKSTRTNHALVEPVRDLFCNGSVLISRSSSILENLCLEEWIYRHYDFSQNNELILLLWHNNPAVVVGRHQNVWSEVSVDFCRSSQIEIIRRNSGGGTVYHDLQNLNLSFLTSKARYDRKRNLALVGNVLRNYFQIETEISPREDLIIAGSGEKVSGTASKLNAYNSYHHCTLLVDVNRTKLSGSLRKIPITGLKSNATKSVPSPVLNLATLNPTLTIDSLIEHLSQSFSQISGSFENLRNQIHFIDNPMNEVQFAQSSQIHSQFSTWSWVYGKTPRFSICIEFHYQTQPIQMELEIEKGAISKLTFPGPNFPLKVQSLVPKLEHHLLGTRFEQTDLINSIHKFKSETSSSHSILQDTISIAIFNAYKKCLL